MCTRPLLVTLAMSLLFCPGCAKNRWLSRRDYSEMQDPFMESEAVADAESETPRRSGGDKAGKARLSNSIARSESDSDGRDAAPLLGPKPIQRTAASNDPVTQTGRVANAAYPRDAESADDSTNSGSAAQSYEGPALSDFLRRRQAGADSAATTGTSAAESNGSPLANTVNAATTRSPQKSGTPSASAEVEGFSNFLNEKGTVAATSTATATQQTASAVQRGASTIHQVEQDAGDFASWAQQQKANWSEAGAGVSEAVSSTPDRIKQDVQTAARQMRGTAENAVPDFNAPDFSPASEEQARPLMKKFDNTVAAPDFNLEIVNPISKVPAANKEVNPFEVSFNPSIDTDADSNGPLIDSAPPKSSAGTSNKPKPKLDDSFLKDSGWKPLHLTRP